MKAKSIDFKQVTISMPDCVDNEIFEYILEALGVERTEEEDIQSVTLTVTKVEY